MADGNGVTRREFEDLKRDLEDIEKNGSRATRELVFRVGQLERRSDAHDSNWTWLGRGIGLVVFTLMGSVILLAITGIIGGGG